MIFSSDFFANNRTRLRELVKTELIVIAGNGLLQRSADTAYKFKQDANFWYLTGLNEPDLLLVMDRERSYLVVPTRSASREAFDGSLSSEELKEISGISYIYTEHDGWEKITRALVREKRVGVLPAPQAYVQQIGLYTNPARRRLVAQLKKAAASVEQISVGEELRDLRVIKQPEEIQAIQKAIDITAETFNEVLEKSDYAYEYEIEADLTRGFRSRGAEGHAYDPIVAAGKNACTLHYINNNDKLQQGDLIVIDAGAECFGYAADITRTVSLTKTSTRQEQVYDSVKQVQNYAASLLKPGILLKDYEKLVRDELGKKLKELKLIEDITPEAVNKYYPHSTSHFLGLNVHDVGDYDQPLQPGMVLTVEPGIYIPEEGIGVRLEDNILITKTGHKNLSTKIAK